MKLELNLPALERLIGGDTEIEIGIRQQICEQFARHHLKSLMTSLVENGVVKRIGDEMRAQLNAEVEAKFAETILQTQRDAGWCKTVTESRFREPVRQAAQAIIQEHTEQIISDMRSQIASIVQREIVRHIGKEIEAQVKAEIERRLQAVWRELGTQK